MGGIGKAIGSVADFADDVLGIDPNGGGFVPLYDLAGTAIGVGPVGTMGATGVGITQAVTGSGSGSGSGNAGLQNIVKTAMPIAATYAQNQAINDATKIAEQTADKQLSILEKQYNLTRNDLLNAVKNGQITLDKSTQDAINTLKQGYAKATGYNSDTLKRITGRLTPYMSAGDLAFMQQNDLLGINGQEAQRRAYSVMESSPQFQTLMKQSENALLQNASATGGLRGGNTQRALAELRPNLLNQLIQQQLGYLGDVSKTGLNVKQNLGNTETGFAGQNQALQTGLAGAVGGLQSGLGINKAELGLKAPQTIALTNLGYGKNVADVLGGLGKTQILAGLQKNANILNASGQVAGGGSSGGGLGGLLGNITSTGGFAGGGGFNLGNIFNNGGGGFNPVDIMDSGIFSSGGGGFNIGNILGSSGGSGAGIDFGGFY